jgi:hypothetical protein
VYINRKIRKEFFQDALFKYGFIYVSDGKEVPLKYNLSCGPNWDKYFHRLSTNMIYKIMGHERDANFVALEDPIEYKVVSQKYEYDYKRICNFEITVGDKIETFEYGSFWKPYKCGYGCSTTDYHCHGN